MPSAVAAMMAKAFRADIRLLHGSEAANSKSITSILLLATNPNDAIRVSATGPDAAAAVSAMADALASGSAESEAAGAVPPAGPAPAAAAAPPIPGAATDPRRRWGASVAPGVSIGT